MKPHLPTTAALLTVFASPIFAVEKQEIIQNYANIAQAGYTDSFTTVKSLKVAVEALVQEPSEANLNAARAAWVSARVPYQQTEVFRFGNAIVDEWEGKVNAWPLDEGLIDYVDTSYGGPTDENEFAALNVIANPAFSLSGKDVDATEITPEFLRETLHEADGVEANVATGYHAIEFLLWGQDLNGTEAGAGSRSWTDYAAGEDCTNGNCDRRAAYLSAVTQLLVDDLAFMADQWGAEGEVRTDLLGDEAAAITAMLTGMGSLSYGELAGERMRLGLMLNDPEEEHDCFSDNTHNSHYFDGLGVQNVYLGSYTGIDGKVVSGASLSDLVAASDADLDAEMQSKVSATMRSLGLIKSTAEAGFAYDQMMKRGDEGGEALIMGGVNGLIDQTKTIERIVTLLALDGASIEGSDSLDNPTAVFE